MTKYNQNSWSETVFHAFRSLEKGATLAGYAALIAGYNLTVPPHNRIERWGKIIGEAGQKRLNIKELENLQKILITDNRFINFGCRTEGGFVGDHDRVTGMPMPVHISARPEDLQILLSGLIETYRLLGKSTIS